MSAVRKRFGLLFFLKKQKNEKGNQVIYLRITINGKRTEFSTKRECEPTKWSPIAGRVKGSKENIRALNSYLDLLQAKVYEAHHELISEGKYPTGELLKNKMTGVEEKPRTLMPIIQHHNDRIKELIGKGYTKATWTKYRTTESHVEDFLKWK